MTQDAPWNEWAEGYNNPEVGVIDGRTNERMKYVVERLRASGIEAEWHLVFDVGVSGEKFKSQHADVRNSGAVSICPHCGRASDQDPSSSRPNLNLDSEYGLITKGQSSAIVGFTQEDPVFVVRRLRASGITADWSSPEQFSSYAEDLADDFTLVPISASIKRLPILRRPLLALRVLLGKKISVALDKPLMGGQVGE